MNPTNNIVSSYKRPNTFSLDRKMHRCYLSKLLFSIVLDVLSSAKKQEKKRCKDWKEVKLPIFLEKIFFHVEKPAESNKTNTNSTSSDKHI